MKVTKKEFSAIYQKHVEKVYSYWTTKMQSEIAKHNKGWGGKYNFHSYLVKSEKRFYLAYQSIDEQVKTIADIGGFWGVLPLTLQELGFDVTMTEAKKYYSDSFDPLFTYIQNNGVKILDIDPFEEKFPSALNFDFVTVMAVLEHFPHSLGFFLENISSLLENKGKLYIDVPNIAYAVKRFNLLRGRSPLPNITTIYESATPFIGHHHEFTITELRTLFERMNLKILKENLFNYSNVGENFKFFLRKPISTAMMSIIPSSREVIGILGEKK